MAKIVAGMSLCFVTTAYVSWIDYSWCLISVVLVLSPEGTDALDLAFTRIKGNVVGACSGFLLLATHVPYPYNLVTGAVLSLFLCDQFNLNAGARSTLAATIIVLLHKEGTHLWDAALGRVAAVIIGCLLGLAVTYVFHSLFKIDLTVESQEKAESPEPEKKEGKPE